jgi:hypothetical protein
MSQLLSLKSTVKTRSCHQTRISFAMWVTSEFECRADLQEHAISSNLNGS